MKKFKDGDKVQVIDVPTHGKHYLNKTNRLMDGSDCILMVTDPPYGVDYHPEWRNEAAEKGLINYADRSVGKVKNDERVDWSEAYSFFSGDIIYVWHAGRHASSVQDSIERCGFEIVSQIIWAKSVFAISRGDYHWQHEPCWYATRKGKPHNWQGSRKESTLWQMGRSEMDTGLSTQKNIECMMKPILNNTATSNGVYDPFIGSGTTLIACEKTNRKCYGMEIEPNYCATILERWHQYTGFSPEKIEEA